MAVQVRVTTNVARVLRAMLEDPGGEHYGYELMKATGLQSGALYPVLARLEGAEWIESRRESVEPGRVGRPARRVYRFTPDGLTRSRQELARLHAILSPAALGLPVTPLAEGLA